MARTRRVEHAPAGGVDERAAKRIVDPWVGIAGQAVHEITQTSKKAATLEGPVKGEATL
ncbi:hypothetical protein GCM10007157_34310 [Vreelandella hamiltonii]|uniref:Uncharacterized protein n=1 Tax=Vreelandella hamiltonii TaxID=502829 RepID=A0A8H9I6S9_9GAMM|nr:hypothetical protein GCM10007157_34310 [Halomonas hamiltonii]